MPLFSNAAADLNIVSVFSGNGGSNLTTNSASTAVDLSNYLGIVAVALNTLNQNTGTTLQVYMSSGNDTNVSNSSNLSGGVFTNSTNAVSGLQVLGVDTRTAKRYLFVNWLISGTGTATGAADCTLIAQAKSHY